PPWTSKVSSPDNAPRSNTLVQTVKKVSGSAAASTSLKPSGIGRQLPAGATQYSAYPPPGVNAQTRSPIFSEVPARSPSTISPATSSPGKSEAPGGGG